MLRWMFWEQYNHEPNVATLRFWHGWIGEANWSELLARAISGQESGGGGGALVLMDEHLSRQDWLVGDGIDADIALYAYTHVAEGGGFRLADYPAVEALAETVEALNYLAMAA